jgi:hypothetical protein
MRLALLLGAALVIGFGCCLFAPKPTPAPDAGCVCEHDSLGDHNCVCPE